MQKVLPALINDLLGIKIIDREDLPESIQYTNEVIPDQLSKITDSQGGTYILHIEWQSRKDVCMTNRMLTYRAMLRRKYNLLVKQYVIFLEHSNQKISPEIEEEQLKFSYHMIELRQYDYQLFLKSEIPEQQLLAIFGDFGAVPPTEVISQIMQRLKKNPDGDLTTNKLLKQLRVLTQLRKLQSEFKTAMGTITKFKAEKDPYYIEGFEKGIQQGVQQGVQRRNHAIVINLIQQCRFSDEQAAKAVGVPIELVQQIRKELEDKDRDSLS